MASMRHESNPRTHSNPTQEARRRTRTLVIIATIALFFLAVRSTEKGNRSISGFRTTLSRQLHGHTDHVSYADSRKALNQLKEISEDSKSATADSQRQHMKVDPVSVASIKKLDDGESETITKSSSSSSAKTGTIVTCPACRLNALPKVKRFVYEYAKHFEPGLKVNFIRGRDPVLHLYEDGKEVETIPLHPYSTEGIVHKLVKFGINPGSSYGPIEEAIKQMNQ